tara:strand:+ start:311 stop:610 length:300 start_codon:yes stop_codon:yes gene_type:complete
MKKMSKMYAAGGKTGDKLKMVKNKEGKEVPFFAADGEGKMMGGGMVPKTKGYFKGGKTKGYSKGGKIPDVGEPVPFHPMKPPRGPKPPKARKGPKRRKA